MNATHVTESFVNATDGYMFGDSTMPVDETVFEDMTPGDAYRWLMREYGRCTGKVYRDVDGSAPVHCGWVFQSRDQYEDSNDTYLREVWVTFSRETAPATGPVREPVALTV